MSCVCFRSFAFFDRFKYALWKHPSFMIIMGTTKPGNHVPSPLPFGRHNVLSPDDDIPDGTLVVSNGIIMAVGPSGEISVPKDAMVHDASGQVIMPGLVDTHSHVAEVEGADASAPIQPDIRVIDSINARDAGIQKAQAGGVTTANIMSGSGHLLSGQTEAYVPKTRVVLFEAGVAAAHGLSFSDALASITINAARLLGIQDRVGSLEVGKDADIALYDGDPFEYTTHCVGVLIDGVVVSDEIN